MRTVVALDADGAALRRELRFDRSHQRECIPTDVEQDPVDADLRLMCIAVLDRTRRCSVDHCVVHHTENAQVEGAVRPLVAHRSQVVDINYAISEGACGPGSEVTSVRLASSRPHGEDDIAKCGVALPTLVGLAAAGLQLSE
jgi:hypothetical protein